MSETHCYLVALEHKDHVEGYAGVRWWTAFPSEQAFEAWYAEEENKNNKNVLGKGITQEEAMQLTRGTPPKCYLLAALYDSTDKTTGKVDLENLPFALEKAMFGIANTQL